MEDEINEEINIVLHYLKIDMKFKCESFEELKKIFLKRINNNTLDGNELKNIDDYQFFIDGESNPIKDEDDFNILKNDIDTKIKEITVKNYKIKTKNNNNQIINNINKFKDNIKDLLITLKEEIKTEISNNFNNIIENEKEKTKSIENKIDNLSNDIKNNYQLIFKLKNDIYKISKKINEENNNPNMLNNTMLNNTMFNNNTLNTSLDFDVKDLLNKTDIEDIKTKLNEMENKIIKNSKDNENKIIEIKSDLKKLIDN